MKIALIGYGKMGKTLEAVALRRGHEVVLRVDLDNSDSITASDLSKADVALEFTQPETAFRNIMRCFDARVPVVCGTTGWTSKLDEVKELCTQKGHSFFYASNYSIGVNIFFEINKKLASLMHDQSQYDEVLIHESHHIHKLDAPSGTAITLADQIIDRIGRLKEWKSFTSQENLTHPDAILPIFSTREDEVPGTHIVKYFSPVDEIEIIHKALTRQGFAEGAVIAAEFIRGKKGAFGMQDLLRF
jgi:4-hydroxy-tetrahydrodipicolinate reductase